MIDSSQGSEKIKDQCTNVCHVLYRRGDFGYVSITIG
jgi:hypothetical protein